MINQARISTSIWSFREEFLNYWNLRNYHDQKQPAIFLGAYKPEDIQAINEHKGFKVIWLTGADMKNVNELTPTKNMVFRSDPTFGRWILQTAKLPRKTKHVNIPMKSYDMFQPCKLGDKVYCYVGKGHNTGKFHEDILRQVAAKSNFEFLWGVRGQTIERIRDKYYNRCFVSLRLNPFAGGTTALELAFMGRKSIGNRMEAWYLPFESVTDIIHHIEEESKKIGTIQPGFIPANHFCGEEWKDENFWLE